MELLIFIAFQLLMEVQSSNLTQAKLTASASVILETDTVQLSCENTEHLKMGMCGFNINGREGNSKLSTSCQLSLTGSQISIWSGGQSSSVNITCYYTVMDSQQQTPSPHSDPITVTVKSSTTTTTAHTTTAAMTTMTVLGSLQKPFISVSDNDVQINIACEIPLSVRDDFNCSLYTEDGLLHRSVSQRIQSREHSCVFHLSHSELFTQSVNSRRLSCDYSLNTEPEVRSPRSDTHTVRALNVRSTSETTTSSKTATTAAISTTEAPASTRAAVSSVHNSAAETNAPLAPPSREEWFIVLVSTGVGVIVTGLICLCWFACKKRRKRNNMRLPSDQGIGMSSGPAETYSVISSVPATSQPISVGLKHPESHKDSASDTTATYSFTMSENSVYQPSEVLVKTQQKQKNTEENESVYHLYCTIPDKPVHSNAEDQVYSLVKMH